MSSHSLEILLDFSEQEEAKSWIGKRECHWQIVPHVDTGKRLKRWHSITTISLAQIQCLVSL